MRREDGTEAIGWRVRDALLGRSRYWTWATEGRRPTRMTSAWQKAGLEEVFPVAWRPYYASRMEVPHEPLALREVDVMLKRAILTDGTLLRSGQALLKSSWDSDMHNDETPLIDQVNLEIFERFIPEHFDEDNYLVGMDWLARINKMKSFDDLSREQNCVIWRAYDYSFAWIGEEILGDVSRQRAQVIYRAAIDKTWRFALADEAKVRRIPRSLWQK